MTVRRWISWGIMMPLFLVMPISIEATMYRCWEKSGTMVLTDSPAQLEECTVLDPQNPTAQAPSSPQLNSKGIPRNRQTRPVTIPPQQPAPEDTTSPQHDPLADAVTDKPAAEPIVVPITRIGGSIVVQVLLNHSVDAHLIVDTGATMTVLSYDLGIELGLLSGSDVSLNTVNTAGGSVQVSMTKVESIEVGRAQTSNVPVAIHDLPDAIPGVSGLLGMSFLKNFEVTLDANQGFLKLLPKAKQ